MNKRGWPKGLKGIRFQMPCLPKITPSHATIAFRDTNIPDIDLFSKDVPHNPGGQLAILNW
jgi:hypothetical protein